MLILCIDYFVEFTSVWSMDWKSIINLILHDSKGAFPLLVADSSVSVMVEVIEDQVEYLSETLDGGVALSGHPGNDCVPLILNVHIGSYIYSHIF